MNTLVVNFLKSVTRKSQIQVFKKNQLHILKLLVMSFLVDLIKLFLCTTDESENGTGDQTTSYETQQSSYNAQPSYDSAQTPSYETQSSSYDAQPSYNSAQTPSYETQSSSYNAQPSYDAAQVYPYGTSTAAAGGMQANNIANQAMQTALNNSAGYLSDGTYKQETVYGYGYGRTGGAASYL